MGLSSLSKGSIQDKLRWIFQLYDLDGDGLLTRDELFRIISSIFDLMGRSSDPILDDAANREHTEKIFQVKITLQMLMLEI